MAHGIPDFYRGVDIAYQALAQLLVRPTYGGGICSSGGKQVSAGALTTLVSVSGQGMLYGGYLWLDHTATQKDDCPCIELDGDIIVYEPWVDMSTYYFSQPNMFPVCLTRFDDTNFIYSLLFQYGLTFESSLVLKYLESHGRAPWVYYSLVYALV